MNTKLLTLCFIVSIISVYNLIATTYTATPDNYKSFISNLLAGDTLILTEGAYKNGLTLNNINGSAGSRIVITGIDTVKTILEARDGSNTVSLTRCSFLTIENMTIDGKNLEVDAVKAEGTPGNYVHDMILQNLLIINHGAGQQIVGINTKCTAWNWTIRNNKIIGAGTGIYLGNSDGTAPFVNGVIENNCILNTVGYNMEIKFQNDGLRTVPGMILNGKTIIRYNVFSKASGASTGVDARPCLLVGNFPANGDGSDDIYEIYGNFFYQNPVEALFQGTGNIAFYSNVLVNNSDGDGARAVYINDLGSFRPRNVCVFHNTLWAQNPAGGIRLYNPDGAYSQFCQGNAMFSPDPVSGFPVQSDNITDTYDLAGSYVINASADIASLDLYPLSGLLEGTSVDLSDFSSFTDWNLDFNGMPYYNIYRGAYSGSGGNPGWRLQLDNRPPMSPASSVDQSGQTEKCGCIVITPCPAFDHISLGIDLVANKYKIEIFSARGLKISEFDSITSTIDVSLLTPGVYFVKVGAAVGMFVKI